MNILVIGEICIDKHIYGSVPRICPEAPVPVFIRERMVVGGGMARNTESNITSLRPGFITSLLHGHPCGSKTRYIDSHSGQMLLRIDDDPKIEPLESFQIESNIDAVVVSDYNKGFLNENILKEISLEAEKRNIPSFLDTKKILGDWSSRFSFIKINKKEYENNLKSGFKRGSESIIVTLGSHGANYYSGAAELRYPGYEVKLVNSSGCGDSFFAGFVVKYLETKDVGLSIDYANKCGAAAASYPDVHSVTEKDLENIV